MAKRERRPWWAILNGTFRPVMGPAQLGPFNEPPLPPTHDKPCPLCGNPMAEHTMSRSADQAVSTRLKCPPRG